MNEIKNIMLNLKGRVAIVTGAGTVGAGWGNGKATAVLLARPGAQIFGIDINPVAVEDTRAIIEREGGACAARVCDMTVSGAVKAAVDACLQRFDRIDIPVNNVGGSAPGDPATMTEEAWDVAHAVLFLVSDEARYITAAKLVVDGGLSAARPQ